MIMKSLLFVIQKETDYYLLNRNYIKDYHNIGLHLVHVAENGELPVFSRLFTKKQFLCAVYIIKSQQLITDPKSKYIPARTL